MPLPDFKVYYINQKLTYDPPDPYKLDVVSSREPGIAEMVQSVIERYQIKEDFKLHVRVADEPWESEMYTNHSPNPPEKSVSDGLPETYYSFCVFNERYHKAFPDYIYVGQKESGLTNYTETVNSFVDTPPKTNKVGWIGALACGDKTPRPKFTEMAKEKPDAFEARVLQIPIHTKEGWKTCVDRMSYQQQVDEWKYLIDMEGCGWSGRFKVLMSSPRIVFFVDRPYQEWYFGYMEPWKHYVPVKRDLSDLYENYLKIENDIELQNYIKANQKEFAQKYLTRAAAEQRIYEIIQEMISYYKNNKQEL
jgi:hypothetical protein